MENRHFRGVGSNVYNSLNIHLCVICFSANEVYTMLNKRNYVLATLYCIFLFVFLGTLFFEKNRQPILMDTALPLPLYTLFQ